MRRWITISMLMLAPMLAGCCGRCCGYRLFCRPCMFGGGCGSCGDSCGCGSAGHGAFYPAGAPIPYGPGGPVISTPAPPPATGAPIEKITSAQAIPTKVVR